MNRRAHFIVEGMVQGVGYRVYCRQAARTLGLRGWVRNGNDGTVEIVAEGQDENLARLAAWCRRGHPTARVRNVAETYGEATAEFDSFDIVF